MDFNHTNSTVHNDEQHLIRHGAEYIVGAVALFCGAFMWFVMH